MGRLSQQLGKTAEKAARWYLYNVGFRCIEKIATPMTKIKGEWIHCDKPSVDFIAAMPQRNGSYCGEAKHPYSAARIEVKLCDDNVLYHSRLTADQSNWLSDWKLLGLPAFVLWVHTWIGNQIECYLIDYPNPYFRRGKALSVETAKKISWK